MKIFLSCIFTMIVSVWVMVFLFANFDGEFTIAKVSIAACAVVENPGLPQTKGVATYQVTFTDGEYGEIVCTSNKK